MCIKDLNVDENIITLFNYTNNQPAESELYKIKEHISCFYSQ